MKSIFQRRLHDIAVVVVSLWGVSYRFCDEHPRHFYMRVPPGINSALISLSYGPHFLSPLVYVLDVSSSTWKNTGSVTNSQAPSSSGKNTRGYQYVFVKSLPCNSVTVSGCTASISVLFLRSSSTRPSKCRKPIDHNTRRLNFETWRKHAK